MNATPVNWTGNLPGGLNSLNTDWIPSGLENGFPVVEPVYDVQIDSLIPFRSKPERGAALHFFLDDYRFECVWKRPDYYAHKFREYDAIMAPDFSLFTDWPDPVNRWNHYRKMYLSAYLQRAGCIIIPVAGWSNELSFSYCFSGMPKRSCIAVSTMGCTKCKDAYRAGFKKMIQMIDPIEILIAQNCKIDNCDGIEYNYDFKSHKYVLAGA